MNTSWQDANLSHVADMLALMQDYYAEDGYPFAAEEARGALERFLSNPDLGRAWVLVESDVVRGYLVLTLGYSLEYRGPDAFIDEIYITPAFRGAGHGERGLTMAEEGARQRGVRMLHLEVERAKPRTAAFYRRVGFVDHERWLLTKPLT